MKVSVCIACHNQEKFLAESIGSVMNQDYKNIEIILLDDASTDKTFLWKYIFCGYDKYYFRSEEPSGTGGAFNKAISHATGDIIYLLCSDDIITDKRVISDVVDIFKKYPEVVHVTRYYHQFVDGDPHPVRAWRMDDIMELANNPSGLAFRRSAIGDCQLSNKMFVEASSFVSCIRKSSKVGWTMIMPWDTIAVRVHKSIARSPDYYKKMWKSSPVEEWAKVGWKSRDFTHLIQVRNYFTWKATFSEVTKFIRLNKWNLIHPAFWFFAAVALLTPRVILFRLPEIYRATWGRWTTRAVKRP